MRYPVPCSEIKDKFCFFLILGKIPCSELLLQTCNKAKLQVVSAFVIFSTLNMTWINRTERTSFSVNAHTLYKSNAKRNPCFIRIKLLRFSVWPNTVEDLLIKFCIKQCFSSYKQVNYSHPYFDFIKEIWNCTSMKQLFS